MPPGFHQCIDESHDDQSVNAQLSNEKTAQHTAINRRKK